MDLDRAVQYLAQCRQEVAEREAEMEMAQAALESTKEWTHLVSLKAGRGAAVQAGAEADADLRELAVNIYAINGVKQLHPGVTIKEYTHLDYSPAAAKDYCLGHRIQAALKLDTKAFEKLAPGLDLDFVETVKEFRATIASDLTPWLTAEPRV